MSAPREGQGDNWERVLRSPHRLESSADLVALEARIRAALLVNTPRLFNEGRRPVPTDYPPVQLEAWASTTGDDPRFIGLTVTTEGFGPLQAHVRRLVAVPPDEGGDDGTQTYTFVAPTFGPPDERLDFC